MDIFYAKCLQVGGKIRRIQKDVRVKLLGIQIKISVCLKVNLTCFCFQSFHRDKPMFKLRFCVHVQINGRGDPLG